MIYKRFLHLTILLIILAIILGIIFAIEGQARTVEPYTITVPQEIEITAEPTPIIAEEKPYSPETVDISRGDREPVKMECTAYTLRSSECGKTPDNPWYGITASGEHVKEWHTVAASKNIPFGTKVYIPFFKDKPNRGVFTVLDRGGSVGPDNIDIYMEDLGEALGFGRRTIEVYILPDAVMEGAE